MKTSILLTIFNCVFTLVGHGFICNTSILLAYKNDYQSIRTLCANKRYKKIIKRQSLYRVKKDIQGTELRKGDQLYLDSQHNDHLEVFNKFNRFKSALRLDGTEIENTSKAIFGRRL